MRREYIITDELYKKIKTDQPFKRITLRRGDSMPLTTTERTILDIIYFFLLMQKDRSAVLTEIYYEVRRVLHYPSLRRDKIKSVLLIMYIKHLISWKNKRRNYYTSFVNGKMIKTPSGEHFTQHITLLDRKTH